METLHACGIEVVCVSALTEIMAGMLLAYQPAGDAGEPVAPPAAAAAQGQETAPAINV